MIYHSTKVNFFLQLMFVLCIVCYKNSMKNIIITFYKFYKTTIIALRKKNIYIFKPSQEPSQVSKEMLHTFSKQKAIILLISIHHLFIRLAIL